MGLYIRLGEVAEYWLCLVQTNAVVSRSISFLCTCLYSPSEWLLLRNDVLKFTGLFPALSPQIHHPTVASVHNSKRSSQTPKCRAEAWGAFTWLNTTSLCVCSSLTTVREGWDSRVPRNSPDLDPGCLCSLSDTCGGLWMSLWWDWGMGMVKKHTVIHQPSMASLPFRYRYPLRHKDPAASSGRLTHNIGHQCHTAPFSPLRKSASLHLPVHVQWTEVDSSCV